ncbi:MAG TPA: alpha/beta hydrolase, partial [Roseimicrobium sp.]|nr:alpha/beta hydrolase [Roseimicrobium sp.]
MPLRIASFAGTAAVFLGIVWMGTRAQSQSDLQEELNVVYGEVAGQKLSMDIFRPSNTNGTNGLPVVLFVHGGGWAGGSRKDFHELAKGAARRGYFSASVGYRLVNGTTNNIYPAQLDDVQRAVRWVRSHAADYHLDPKKVGALGASAGGHLVTLLGTVETRDKKEDALSKYSSKVQCVVDIFGPTDLTTDFTKNGDSGPMVQNLVNNLIGLPREASLEPYKAASPLFYVGTNTA